MTDDLEGFELGADAVIGEHGSNLSGGQKQVSCISKSIFYALQLTIGVDLGQICKIKVCTFAANNLYCSTYIIFPNYAITNYFITKIHTYISASSRTQTLKGRDSF